MRLPQRDDPVRAVGHGRGIATPPPDFDRYVDPINTQESSRLCPPQYYLPPPPSDFHTFRRLWLSSSILAQALELRLMMRIRGLIEITSNHYKLTQSCKTSKQTPILQASRTWSWREEKKNRSTQPILNLLACLQQPNTWVMCFMNSHYLLFRTSNNFTRFFSRLDKDSFDKDEFRNYISYEIVGV